VIALALGVEEEVLAAWTSAQVTVRGDPGRWHAAACQLAQTRVSGAKTGAEQTPRMPSAALDPKP
jgi:hypothetical protein